MRQHLAPGGYVIFAPNTRTDEALAEVDGLIAELDGGAGRASFERCRALFVHAGLLREVSVSFGWHDEFLTFAERIDQALKDLGA